MLDPKLRGALEHIIRGGQANVDHLSGEARIMAKRLNRLIDEVAVLYDLLGVEVDPDSGPSSTVLPANHDELEGVSANDHHNQAHDQGDHNSAETGDLAAVAAAAAAGSSVEVPNADHVHPHGTGYAGAHSDAVNDGDAAGGDLSGTYPNPSVTDDSHSHGSGTAPGTAHPDLSTHDALGLATDAELATHAAASDPHTGYRLESADHTHASTGAQAGQLDHGTALTGLTDDDHPQYMLESLIDAVGDIIVGSADNTPARLPKGTDGQVLSTDSAETLDLKWIDPPAGSGGSGDRFETFFFGSM